MTFQIASGQTGLLMNIRSLMDSWFGAMVGGAVYGAWASWANWDHGASHALTIGLAHWVTSALLTFFGTMTMRKFFGSALGAAGGLRALFGGLALTYFALLVVHTTIGTQHILLTIAPGILPNVLFCSSYALLLMRTHPVASLS